MEGTILSHPIHERKLPTKLLLEISKQSTPLGQQGLKDLMSFLVHTVHSALEAVPIGLPTLCAVGGAVIGAVAAARALAFGRVTGISGFVQRTVKPSTAAKERTLSGSFVFGLLAAGLVLASVAPSSLQQLPDSYTMARAAAGGFLVGIGSTVGNGCTSGHGICGIGRFSVRSLANVMTFMATGMAAATFTGSAAALEVQDYPAIVFVSSVSMPEGAAALTASIITFLAAYVLRLHVPALSEALFGLTFGLGLGISGMTRPDSVASFLSPMHGGWQAGLMAVMGMGILVAAPALRSVLARGTCEMGKASLPRNNAIDARLLIGGALFGAGWGIAGVCPGPSLVAASGSLDTRIIGYVISMIAGMLVAAKL